MHRSVHLQRQPSVLSTGNCKAIHHLLGRANVNGFRPHQKQSPDLLQAVPQLQTGRYHHKIRYETRPAGTKRHTGERDGPTGIPFGQHHCHSPELLQGKSSFCPNGGAATAQWTDPSKSEIRNCRLGYSVRRSIFNYKWKASTFLNSFTGSLVADPKARLACAQQGTTRPPWPRWWLRLLEQQLLV